MHSHLGRPCWFYFFVIWSWHSCYAAKMLRLYCTAHLKPRNAFLFTFGEFSDQLLVILVEKVPKKSKVMEQVPRYENEFWSSKAERHLGGIFGISVFVTSNITIAACLWQGISVRHCFWWKHNKKGTAYSISLSFGVGTHATLRKCHGCMLRNAKSREILSHLILGSFQVSINLD